MKNRERTLAVLHYAPYDRLPVVHFGYWPETLEKWCAEGHLTKAEVAEYREGNALPAEQAIARKLGFDFGWSMQAWVDAKVMPPFEERVLERRADGLIVYRNSNGLIEAKVEGTVSIPATVGSTLTDRASWEREFKWRLQANPARHESAERLAEFKAACAVAVDYPTGAYSGSLIGAVRDMLGVEGMCYMQADDEELFREIVETIGGLCYENIKVVLETGARIDFLHFWEDICFNNGPLINPRTFEELLAPRYRQIADLARAHGVDFISVDCDGLVDKLVPIWLASGVNIMFPIEVGTWNGSIGPWREQYGRAVRGVGGVRKAVLARDRAAVDAEVERLKPLVALGGYIPCPDHRLPPESKWELVQYYCERVREL
ncbi:MAG: hypothetical protein LBK60_02925 [Verrucomicrobiales bacterium]|jgi:uroporphyrinogen decarboxylase|nr:hypothetical protein [Verrucomicrobiales bacterium]